MSVSVDNQYAALQSSPIDTDDGKSQGRSRKDDIKEQAYQAKEGVKQKAFALKEQLVSGASSTLQQGVQFAKQKAAALTGDASLATADTDELVSEATEAAAGEWETVKARGTKAGKKAVAEASEQVNAKLDANLTPAQKAKLTKGVKQAQAAGKQAVRQAQPYASRGINLVFGKVPQLRGIKTFIERNNLQLPVMIGMAFMSLWMGLTLIRLITTFTTPSVPEFDIHSKEASMQWLKYHAGEYKDKAAEMSDSIPARVAKFLANHEVDKIKADALQKADIWREIGMKKLGLAEPTYGEQLMAWVTGRPLTWQARVESVLDLAKTGLKATALKKGLNAGSQYVKDSVKDSLGLHEPTLTERIYNKVTGHDDSLKARVSEQASSLGDRVVEGIRNKIPGMHAAPEPSLVDSIKNTLSEGVDAVRSHLPGGAEAIAEAKARAYAAAHPSTLDSIKSSLEYAKNRVVHGAEEAAHIAQDRANELADKAKYKTGL